jgi:hypothetical protein
MASAHKCDSCGEFFVCGPAGERNIDKSLGRYRYECVSGARISLQPFSEGDAINSYVTFDFCHQCVHAFYESLRALGGEKK